MEIAKQILNVTHRAEVDAYLVDNLSLYSVDNGTDVRLFQNAFPRIIVKWVMGLRISLSER